MLDVKLLRNTPEIVRENLKRRNADTGIVDEFLQLDEKKRALQSEAEQLRCTRNTVSAQLAQKKAQNQDISADSLAMREVGNKIKEIESELAQIEEQTQQIIETLPNIPHPDVPDGFDENSNLTLRSWGELRKFDFAPQAHWDLGEKLGILDIPRAVKIAKARFVVLKKQGALLERALINFMLNTHTLEHGYTEVCPPFLVNSASMYGTGQLPRFKEDSFKCEGWDLYLIATSEIPVTNLHREEILEEKDLPLYYTAYSSCFRSEAGAAGKDTRGMIRVHQFDKVELIKFSHPDTSFEELDKMTADAEVILQRLKLPYRVVAICIGDLGFTAAKKYDLEVFCPGQDRWLEVSSLSNCTDFQARRANIRFRDEKTGKPRYAHTLNGSGLAIGRILLSILENYQQEDGSVIIPEVLRPYMHGMEKISPLGK